MIKKRKNNHNRRYTDRMGVKRWRFSGITLFILLFAMLMIKISPKIANIDKSDNKTEIETIVAEIAPRYSLDPALVLAMIEVESQGKATAISRAGAIGLMQVMPQTCKYYVKSTTITLRDIKQMLFDPEFNIDIGCQHLKMLMDRARAEALHKYSGGARNYNQKVKKAMVRGKNE